MSRHRVAVVGCGGVSDMHFRGYLAEPDRVDVVGAVDPVAERREWAQATHGVRAYASIAELVDAVDFDAATVCTPSTVRLPAVEELAAAGKHLHVEKPMADGLEEARRIVEVAADAGVLLAVDQNFRDHYSFGLARDAIRDGRIGRVRGIDHRELTFREVVGWRAESPHHALSVMGVHWFDGFRYLLGREADWLVATAWRSPAVTAAGETDAVVHVRFGDVGVNYTQSFSSRVERVETVVLGDEGTLAFGYDRLEIATEDGVEVRENPCAGPGKPTSAFRSLARLLDAVEGGRAPTNSGADNLRTLSLLEAAYRSAESGERVDFTDGVL